MVTIQASNIKDKEKIVIDLDDIVVKYMNFKPTKIDKVCLDSKIKKLFTIIRGQEIVKSLFSNISKEYFLEKNKNIRERIKKLSGQLLMQKHISYKGNHEWHHIVSGKYLVIESEKNHIYVMYSLERMFFMISGKSFDNVKDRESLLARDLKEWIDMKECIVM